MKVIGKSQFFYTSEKDITDHILLNRGGLLGQAATHGASDLVKQVMKDYDWDKTPDYTGRKSRIIRVIDRLLDSTPYGKESRYTSEEDICRYILTNHFAAVEKEKERGAPPKADETEEAKQAREASQQEHKREGWYITEQSFRQIGNLKVMLAAAYGWDEKSVFRSSRIKRIENAIVKAKYFIRIQNCNQIRSEMESNQFKPEVIKQENYPILTKAEIELFQKYPTTLIASNEVALRINDISKKRVKSWDKVIKFWEGGDKSRDQFALLTREKTSQTLAKK